VRVKQFFIGRTRILFDGRVYLADYVATGGELFIRLLAGGVLTLGTLGTYYFWFLAGFIEYQNQSTVIYEPN
jgi:hypothetical protein